MKNIFVTGVTGFIGSHTTVELFKSGYNVIGIDNLFNSNIEILDSIKRIAGRDVKFYRGDLVDINILDKIFAENEIDSVMHFAGFKAVGESVEKPLDYYYNNLVGTLNILKLMKKHNINHFVFSSSATVYDKDNPIPYVENFKKSSTNPYGYSKVMVEQILSDMSKTCKDFSCAMLRYFNPIGAHESGILGENPKGVPNNLMPYICDVAIGKREYLNVFGNDFNTIDGTGVRDYIHIVDLARGHVKALKYIFENKGEISINLGTGKGTSVFQLVKAFEEVSGKKINFKICERRKGDIDEFYADVNKAKEVLNWEAKYSINDMCRDSWNFIKSKI